MKKPTILYIAPCWPHAKPFGSQKRVLQVARALKEVGELKLAIVDFPGSEPEAIQKSADEFAIEFHGYLEQEDTLPWAKRLLRDFNPRALNPHHWIADATVRTAINDRVGQFDLIWFSSLRMTNSFERWEWPHSVMDVDDLPSSYERTFWRNGAGLRKRVRAGLEMIVWKQREKLLGQRFTILTVCSEADRQSLGAIGPIHVIPNGFERPAAEPSRTPADPPRLGFIGQFGYFPNFQGIRWFVDNCWPRIKRKVPNASLRLIGKGSDGPSIPSGSDIEALGWMEDTEAEIATWSAMIVPVRVGAGTRVKIAEAFSRKCPLVSTSVGAHGYDIADGRELCMADTPEQFAAACVKLIGDRSEAVAMAERAWKRFVKEWTWDAIAPRVWAAAEDCLRRSA